MKYAVIIYYTALYYRNVSYLKFTRTRKRAEYIKAAFENRVKNHGSLSFKNTTKPSFIVSIDGLDIESTSNRKFRIKSKLDLDKLDARYASTKDQYLNQENNHG